MTMADDDHRGIVEEGLKDISRLKKFGLFDNVSEDDLNQIGRESRVLTLETGHVVCEEDTGADSMFFIESGGVSISKSDVVFARLDPGDYFGEMSLITGSERSATGTALEPSVLFEISANVFDKVFKRSPEAMYNLLLTFDARLRRHNDVVVEQFLKMKEQFKELEGAHNRLLLSDKMASIGLLTAGIAHEINNPLFVITGYLNVLNESLKEGGISVEELKEIAGKLDTASNSIVKLVSGIKTYVHIERTFPVPIDLNSAIQDSLDLVAFLYTQDLIELKTGFSEESPRIFGNLGKLQQVLMNLLSNARDAMEGRDTKVITVETFEDNDQVIIEVSDTGTGIDPDDIPKVFNSTYTTKPVGKGSGMGLDLVRKIVEDMQGTIEVVPEARKGATFRIVFPKY
jgi:signal transduction histidine kinase